MLQPQSELEEVLLLVARENRIPLDTRYKFFEYVQKNDGLDKKAVDFLEGMMKYLSQQEEKAASIADRRALLFGNTVELQKKPEFSLSHKIVEEASDGMTNLADNFIEKVKDQEQRKDEKAENTEHQDDLANIEALKALLVS